MTAKELERLIAKWGGNPTALDTVTRKLREGFDSGRSADKPYGLGMAGRGPNAHLLSHSETVWIILAFAGSENASRCMDRLVPLCALESPGYFPLGEHRGLLNLLQPAIEEALSNPATLDEIEEIRIGRNEDWARIVLTRGRTIDFGNAPKHGFRSEGVLGADLLREVAQALARTEPQAD